MIPALNMHLEDVRIVLKNEVNDITVCRDMKEVSDRFYTMISVKSDQYRKYITEQMNKEGLFSGCNDFVGSFSVGKELKLLFHYQNDSPMENVEGIYLYDFARCRRAAMSLVSTVAAKGLSGQIIRLLLNSRNVNLNSECEVSLNYFLDFQEYDMTLSEFHSIDYLAARVFEILEQPWKEKLEGNLERYPDELKLFHMKIQNHSFLSYGQLMAQMRSMPLQPVARRGMVHRIDRFFKSMRRVLFQNQTRIALTILVLVTILYTGYQIGMRIRAQWAYEKNVSYSALEYIGTVYLGNEE